MRHKPGFLSLFGLLSSLLMSYQTHALDHKWEWVSPKHIDHQLKLAGCVKALANAGYSNSLGNMWDPDAHQIRLLRVTALPESQTQTDWTSIVFRVESNHLEVLEIRQPDSPLSRPSLRIALELLQRRLDSRVTTLILSAPEDRALISTLDELGFQIGKDDLEGLRFYEFSSSRKPLIQNGSWRVERFNYLNTTLQAELDLSQQNNGPSFRMDPDLVRDEEIHNIHGGARPMLPYRSLRSQNPEGFVAALFEEDPHRFALVVRGQNEEILGFLVASHHSAVVRLELFIFKEENLYEEIFETALTYLKSQLQKYGTSRYRGMEGLSLLVAKDSRLAGLLQRHQFSLAGSLSSQDSQLEFERYALHDLSELEILHF